MDGFVFTDDMIRDAIREVEAAGGKTICNPRPMAIEGSSHFILMTWDYWFYLVSFLKKELRNRSPERSLQESNGSPLFELRFEDNKFKLIILQEWASKRLGLPQEYIVSSADPLKSYIDILQAFNNPPA